LSSRFAAVVAAWASRLNAHLLFGFAALREVELFDTRHGAAYRDDTYYVHIVDIMGKHGLKNAVADRKSHFVLRLAYCRNEELRSYLLRHEVMAFTARFIQASQNASKTFMEDVWPTLSSLAGSGSFTIPTPFNHVALEPLLEANDELRKRLVNSSRNVQEAEGSVKYYLQAPHLRKASDCPFFVIPFQAGLDLLRRRNCYVSKGKMYISRRDIVEVVANAFRAQLAR
jgi:DNA primase large subunit